MAIIIRLAGEPCGVGRPRISTRNGMVRAYTPEKTRNYSAALRLVAQQAMAGSELFTGPVRVVVSASMSIPESFSKAKRLSALAGAIHPTKKPDIDNIAKHFDALNGVVWVDDRQIIDTRIFKTYALTPQLEIRVEAI